MAPSSRAGALAAVLACLILLAALDEWIAQSRVLSQTGSAALTALDAVPITSTWTTSDQSEEKAPDLERGSGGGSASYSAALSDANLSGLTVLQRAGRLSRYAHPRGDWGYLYADAAAWPNSRRIHCEALLAAVHAPYDPDVNEGRMGCDINAPAFPAYHACLQHLSAIGALRNGSVMIGSTITGLGNQLRLSVGGLLLALATGRSVHNTNKFFAQLFLPPELPRIRGQSDAQYDFLMGRRREHSGSSSSSRGSGQPSQLDELYASYLGCRPDLSSSDSAKWQCEHPGGESIMCGDQIDDDQRGYRLSDCRLLDSGDVNARFPGKKVSIDGWYDVSRFVLANPRYGLTLRRLFCTSSPIRIQAMAFSWMHSRPHPDLVLAATALASKLGLPFPRATSPLHGMPVATRAQMRAIVRAPRPEGAPKRCPANAAVVGIQLRLHQAQMKVNDTAGCALRGLQYLLARLVEGAVSGPRVYNDTHVPGLPVDAYDAPFTQRVVAESLAGKKKRQQQRRLCLWVTADHMDGWRALERHLAPLGTLIIDRDSIPGHTSESGDKPDLPAALGLQRTPFLDELKMDVVHFYLLGEVDHMVKAQVSSFGEYGFLRSGLKAGFISSDDSEVLTSFVRHNLPRTKPWWREGCIHPTALDAGYLRVRPSAGGSVGAGSNSFEAMAPLEDANLAHRQRNPTAGAGQQGPREGDSDWRLVEGPVAGID